LSPSLSVILPVYNAESFLKEAIDSLLNQTFSDFELLVYDDGSTDKSRLLIDTYTDPRIIRKYSDINQGLIKVLNTGFNDAQGKYIVRMDADDICLPDRFQKQFDFMEAHPKVGICGTQLKLIHNDEAVNRPTDDIALRWWFFKGSPLAHPSVIIRNSVIKEHQLRFDSNVYVAEDFDLWWKMAFHCQMANIDEALVRYRIHPGQESSAKSEKQNESHRNSLHQFMRTIGLDNQEFSIQFVQSLLTRELASNYQNILKVISFFNTLIQNANACKFYGKDTIISERNNQMQYLVNTIQKFEFDHLKLLKNSDFKASLKSAGIQPVIFIVKSLIKWKTR